MRKFTEFTGCRMTISPTLITDRYRTQYGNHPAVIANVVIHWPSEDQDLGPVYIFQNHVIGQIRSLYDGRPIEATLRKGQDPRIPELSVYLLEDAEVKA